MAIVDTAGDGIGAPAVEWFAITPHDSNELTIRPRCLFVSVAGDISIISKLGTTMTITVAAGYHTEA